MILLADVDCAPESVLRVWYRRLPAPRTDEEREVMERLCARVEGCGMVDADGELL